VRFTLLALAALLAPGGSNQNIPPPRPLTVSAAVSLTDALTAIAADYAGAGLGTVRFNFAASNVLARQIVNGAPVDVFISADDFKFSTTAKFVGESLLGARDRVHVFVKQLFDP